MGARRLRHSVVVVTSAVTIVTLLIAAPGAGATVPSGPKSSSWSLESVPLPSQINSLLNNVSCPSSNTCMAVGMATTGIQVSTPLAESWNGASWTAIQAPGISGSSVSEFMSVSCVSSDSCMAVGLYSTPTVEEPLSESWNGTSWTIDSPATLANGANLESVACVSADSCVAVGSDGQAPSNAPFAESWNGSQWTEVSVPFPAGAVYGTFSSISCGSSGSCEAVGSYGTNQTPYAPLAEGWSGSSFSLQTPQDPSGSPVAELNAVSCTGTTFCMATGDFIGNSTPRAPLAETWNGTAWNTVSTPEPANAIQVSGTGVSCISPDECDAVGYYEPNGGKFDQLPWSMSWDGSSWKLEAVSESSTWRETASLNGIGCASSSSSGGIVCVAAGNAETSASNSESIAETWNGQVWSASEVSQVSGQIGASLYDVDCLSASLCYAVGNDGNANPEIYESDGTSWTLMKVPTVKEGLFLEGISCVSSTDCLAVGVAAALDHKGVAESWNGKSWKVVKGEKGLADLSSVSCVSTTFCMTVGDAPADHQQSAKQFAETWNGSKLTVTRTPSPPGTASAKLYSVSCTTETSCIAVGVWNNSTDGNPNPLIEAWNGKDWAIEQSAAKPTASLGFVGVSCPTSESCVAVGYSIDRFDSPVAVAETWNGKTWTNARPVSPAGGIELYSIDCVSSTDCIAVGGRGHGTVAESWNGQSWSLEQTANPSGANGSGYLEGISCITGTGCTAVGYYTNSSGTSLPIVEGSASS